MKDIIKYTVPIIHTVSIISIFVLLSACMYGCENPANHDGIADWPAIYPDMVYDPSWHPDGNQIIFYWERIISIDKRTGGYLHDEDSTGIYIVDLATHERRLFLRGSYLYSPIFSNDGEWVYFSNGIIYKQSIAGDSLVRVVDNIPHSFSPSLSRDGEWLAFHAFGDHGPETVYIMSLKSTEPRIINYLNEPLIASRPKWFSNGETLLLERGGTRVIARVDTNGENYQLLSENIIEGNSAISHDDQFILFRRDKEIWKKQLNDGMESRITNSLGRYPAFYPDGSKVVYAALDSDGRTDFLHALWIMNPDGGEAIQITDNYSVIVK
ncbi:MAG: hypothetical protein HN356_13380 [Calditrichaeota bacterium]|jgi:Tol biopolymer transport system component|nr:hypothetical protein [Calditrichota bacterium]